MKILWGSCLFILLMLSLTLSSIVEAKQPNLRSTDPAERAMGAQRIAETGVYAKADIDLLVGCLGDFTRLIPSGISLPASTPYSRDQRETSPSKEAEKAIMRIGKPAVPSLLAALKEGRYGKADSHNTYTAAKVLGEMKERSALTRLKQLANGGEYGHLNESGADDEFPIAIAKIAKKDEYEFLRSLLERAERENRVNNGLLEAIGYSEDERSVSVLNEYLKNGDRFRKLLVIKALGHTRSSKAITLLLPYLNNEDWVFQKYARDALKELGRSDLIPKDKQ